MTPYCSAVPSAWSAMNSPISHASVVLHAALNASTYRAA
jgi:hypothetical protein